MQLQEVTFFEVSATPVNFTTPAVPQVLGEINDTDPIDSTTLPKADDLPKLEKTEQFSNVMKE